MTNYSQQKAMAKRFICTQGVLSFRSSPALIITNECGEAKCTDILAMPIYKRKEIYEFARSYTDKMLVTEYNGSTWVISPSVFPASSLCAVFCFDIDPSRFLRLVKACGREEMFEISRYTEIKRARMSSMLQELVGGMSEFCDDIRLCFYDADRIKRARTAEGQQRVLIDQCHRISILTGCPIELVAAAGEYKNTDLSILSSFLFTMLISARKNAPDRTVRISFSNRAGSALVKVRFFCDASICISPEMLEWEGITADRCMEFYSSADKQEITVAFHAHRYELSAILGIKQEDLPFLSE